VFYFDADNNNTGATTLNVSGLGVKAVQNSGSALSANQILAAGLTGVIYDGTQFQLLTASVDTSSFVTAVDAASTATALAIALG
jgi:predicted component of type VI protein secretion system